MPELNNPVLNQAEQKVESQVLPENRESYNKIVVAGMALALHGGLKSIVASLRQSRDPVADAARGAVAVVLILRKEARGAMPVKAMVPAGTILMLKALDLADRMGLVKVGTAELDRATHIFANFLLGYLHITPGMLQNASARVHALIQDPQAMQAMNMHVGAIPHPGAERVPMPAG